MKKSRNIVAVDIGGTHVRFALASVTSGRRPRIGVPATLRTRDHASLVTAWQEFASQADKPLPKAAAICLAALLAEDTIKLTNSPWVLHQGTLAEELGLDDLLLLNDFGAMAWAVSRMDEDEFEPICGPDEPLPDEGVITILGPGTGLGVAMLVRRDGRTLVIETEGGHVDFAPLDQLESALVDRLSERYQRVSSERIVSGPGLANIHDALAAVEAVAYQPRSDAELWTQALSGEDKLAAAALDRFCLSLGAVAGDLALAHGASAVVLIGGLAQRIKHLIRRSEFSRRFCAKGRYRTYMSRLPVRLAIHPQPGLLGTAVAFAQR